MTKLTILYRRAFAAFALITLFAPAVLASDFIGFYCVEIDSARPFKLATSEISPGYYLLNGTYTDPVSSEFGAVIGSASIADGAITMTLRVSAANGPIMSISTYQFDLELGDLSGNVLSITQSANGSVSRETGRASLVDCESQRQDPHYVDNGNGTVTDSSTGLTWQQSDDGQRRDWQASIDYCSTLTLGTFSSWRLPSIEELENLIDISDVPTINPIFTGTNMDLYWSTSSAANPNSAWNVDFNDGHVYHNYDKASRIYARCVR